MHFIGRIAGSYGNSILIFFEKSPWCFPQYLQQFSILTTMPEGSFLSTYLPTLVISCFSNNRHSNRCEEIFHCGLIFISLRVSDVEHLLMYLLAICMSLGKYMFMTFTHLNWFFFLFFTIKLYVLRHSVVSESLWPPQTIAARLLCPWNFLGENNGVGCHFLIQRLSCMSYLYIFYINSLTDL